MACFSIGVKVSVFCPNLLFCLLVCLFVCLWIKTPYPFLKSKNKSFIFQKSNQKIKIDSNFQNPFSKKKKKRTDLCRKVRPNFRY